MTEHPTDAMIEAGLDMLPWDAPMISRKEMAAVIVAVEAAKPSTPIADEGLDALVEKVELELGHGIKWTSQRCENELRALLAALKASPLSPIDDEGLSQRVRDALDQELHRYQKGTSDSAEFLDLATRAAIEAIRASNVS